MTAPDIVSVIAEEMVGHGYAFLTVPHDRDGTEITCAGCGVSEANPKLPKARWLATHQARAVLASISEAGVAYAEYGVKDTDSEVIKYPSRESAQESIDGILEGIASPDRPWMTAEVYWPQTLVTRTTFDYSTTWTEVKP